MNRPIAVTILAILAVIAALLAIGDVLRYLGLLPVATFGELKFFGFSWIGAIMAGLLALIWLWVAKMLWTLDPRGWLFVVVIAVVNLIFIAVAILGDSSYQDMLLAIVVNGLALILGLLPGTKAAFGQA